jgi:hypothetical protein
MNRFLLLFSLCGLLAAPMMADDNEDRIKAMFEARKSATYEANAFKDVAPLAVGQWVSYGLTDDDGERSIMKCAIVGQEGDAMTMEMTMINEDNTIVMQYTIKGLGSIRLDGGSEEFDIIRIAIKTDDEEPMVLDGAMLAMMKGSYSSTLEGMKPQRTDLVDGGTQTVIGGTFNGTTKVKSSRDITGGDDETTSWVHPSIPIYATVKSVTEDEATMELLDFGMTGAKPSF